MLLAYILPMSTDGKLDMLTKNSHVTTGHDRDELLDCMFLISQHSTDCVYTRVVVIAM